MTDFDRSVLSWLNVADIPDKSKSTVLKRTRASIGIYKDMLEADTGKTLERVCIDVGLDEVAARAERRLAEGMTPIVQLPTEITPHLSHKAMLRRNGPFRPGGTPAGSMAGTPRLGGMNTPRISMGRGNSAVSPSNASESAASRARASLERPIARRGGSTASQRAALVSKPGPMRINVRSKVAEQISSTQHEYTDAPPSMPTLTVNLE